ncbi:N-acetylmuramoyl-L-alanine amidase, family 2 (fragment) [Candidatus Sulfopaludibacter sp. SbA3]
MANEPRWYALMERGSAAATGPSRSEPMGIVFHITESDQAPFEAEQNRNLKRLGRDLLLYARSKRAYHFVIDRFGRVFRVVVESDVANHAGHSVWADTRWTYLSLNASFLGVAFEASTRTDEPPMNQAQLHAAKILVAMLADKYHLSPQNCVTHAQVSVNPSNMRIGWHTDWGTGFPFQELGLPNNYESPNPALSIFGFEYDDSYRTATGPDLWRGITSAEEQMRESAAQHGMTLTAYRTSLQKKYRQAISALRERSGTEEN